MSKLTDRTLHLLEGAEKKLADRHSVVGLDGFVDQIIRVVDKHRQDGSVTHLSGISEWADRIRVAAGQSTKFELSVKQIKLGGNGPIMANALASYGIPLVCIGNMGFPDLHSVFQPMKKNCEMMTIADASYTDAIEFDDGKIMLSRQESASLVTWETLERVLGKEKILKLFEEASLICLNNWTALPHMSGIWRELQSQICPLLSPSKIFSPRLMFFDLADPEFRPTEDIAEALDLISKFESWHRVTLGLNQKEASEICEVLGLRVSGKNRAFAKQSAESIHEKLNLSGVVVHATAFAGAANSSGSALVEGPYTAKPLISTGAGDHFNAGYNTGLLLGGDLEQALQLGVATSGYYVRTAQSPTVAALREFLNEI